MPTMKFGKIGKIKKNVIFLWYLGITFYQYHGKIWQICKAVKGLSQTPVMLLEVPFNHQAHDQGLRLKPGENHFKGNSYDGHMCSFLHITFRLKKLKNTCLGYWIPPELYSPHLSLLAFCILSLFCLCENFSVNLFNLFKLFLSLACSVCQGAGQDDVMVAA